MQLFAFDETADVPYGIKVYAYYVLRILKTFAKSYFNEMHQTMPQVVVFSFPWSRNISSHLIDVSHYLNVVAYVFAQQIFLRLREIKRKINGAIAKNWIKDKSVG